MQRIRCVIPAVTLLMYAGQIRAAGDMCDLLMKKGVLNTDIDLNECRAMREKNEAQTAQSLQDFVKNWISYKEGVGFVLNSAQTAPGDYRNPAPKPRFSFALGNRIQARYTFLSPDAPGSDEDSSFRIRRMKTFINGNAFYPWLKYKLQVNWAGSPELEDAVAEFVYFPTAAVRVGQYKVPFDRQELTSSGAQQFVDRAITHARFTFARDQGVMLRGVLGQEKLEWFEYGVGIFNGNGRNRLNNDNPDHLGVARLYFMPFATRSGYFGYSESDADNTARPALAIGAAYGFNPVRSSTTSTAAITTTIPNPDDPGTTIVVDTGRTLRTTTVADAEIHRTTADVHFKWRGISALADYFYESRDDKTSEVTLTEIGPTGKIVFTMPGTGRRSLTTQTHGFLVQAGYFLIPRKLEVAGRYATFEPEGTSNRQEEARGAINWFMFAHNLKLQADFGAVTRQVKNAVDAQDFEARAQLQLIF